MKRPRPTSSPDPRQPAGWFLEDERSAGGNLRSVLTVLIANRECPWRCVFCDLWQQALEHSLAPGDALAQVDVALAAAPAPSDGGQPRQLKLYNAGSFFDARAIPLEDHPGVADRAAHFERLIVECHPSLVGDRVWRFQERLAQAAGRLGSDTALEVAMGLETADPAVLDRLNKRMTLEGFRAAADRLRSHGVSLRAFVLVQPPFEAAGDAVRGAVRAVDWALEAGATVVSLIPVRSGNPPLEALRVRGLFTPPTLATLEGTFDAALALGVGRGRVFVDLWELSRFSRCSGCFEARRARLMAMNRGQTVEPTVACAACGAGAPVGAR